MASESLARRYRPKYATRNEEIVAGLREAAGAGPPVDPEMRAKKLIAEAATLLALSHGGDWRMQFQPDRGLVVVARRLRSRS